jgi:tRNA-Thr(GGU) m(6)t(6)A37 methyltransferase TsaA
MAAVVGGARNPNGNAPQAAVSCIGEMKGGSGTLEVTPIGIIRSPFTEARGTPIQPALADGAEGTVEVFEQYADGIADLEGFDRIWLIYWFDRVRDVRLKVTPYLDDAERGLFATRAPCRPNPIGMSPVRLVRIEGRVLHVLDVDVLDGTPLLDIKPYSPRFDCFDVGRSGWLDAAADRRAVADGRFHKEESER